MVHLGGEIPMPGQWRLALRRAEAAAQAGRLDEALALAERPEVADHRRAGELRARLAVDLVGRAGRRGESDDLAGALADLALAERGGAAPDRLAAARLALAERSAADVQLDLEAGDPDRAAERADDLIRARVTGPALRRAREVAEAWRGALGQARRGEFGQACDGLALADRIGNGIAGPALAAARADLEARRAEAAPAVEALYARLDAGRPAEILADAEAVLAIVPEHPAARQARARAWRQIAAIGPAAAPRPDGARAAARTIAADPTAIPAPPTPPSAPTKPGTDGRFLLWVDAVGGYLVCTGDEVVLGRAGADGAADVPLLGDLSRRHATLARDGDTYVIRAHRPIAVNGRPAEVAPLRDGDLIRLGDSVELEFRQPSPVSGTARLEIVSRHRLPLAVEGIILMAETCIIGASSQAHVSAPGLAAPVVLYRQGDALWCRAGGAGIEVDGQPRTARAPLSPRSNVSGDNLTFSLEPLGPRSPV